MSSLFVSLDHLLLLLGVPIGIELHTVDFSCKDTDRHPFVFGRTLQT